MPLMQRPIVGTSATRRPERFGAPTAARISWIVLKISMTAGKIAPAADRVTDKSGTSWWGPNSRMPAMPIAL